MGSRTSVLLAIGNAGTRQSVLRGLGRLEGVDVIGLAEEPVEVVQAAISLSPQIVVVGDCPPYSWAQICSFLGLASSQSRMILVVEEADRSAVEVAMLLGVRQIVPSAEVEEAIAPVITKLVALERTRSSDEYLRATDPQRCPRLIAVSGAKGGVGKTTVAVNLGVALAGRKAGGVLIWDAYSQFGDVPSILGVSPTRALGELAEAGDDIDDDFILSYTTHHESGADVLLTALEPVPLDMLREPFVDRVIKALRTRYRFIVADTPPILYSVSTIIFARCWQAMLVTTLKDVTSVSDALKLVQTLESGYVRGGTVTVVANRIGRGDSIKEKEVASLTGKGVAASIPEDPAVGQANNLGVPVCQLAPRGPASRAIGELANRVVDSASTLGPARAPGA